MLHTSASVGRHMTLDGQPESATSSSHHRGCHHMSTRYASTAMSEAVRLAVAGKDLDSTGSIRTAGSSDHAAAKPAWGNRLSGSLQPGKAAARKPHLLRPAGQPPHWCSPGWEKHQQCLAPGAPGGAGAPSMTGPPCTGRDHCQRQRSLSAGAGAAGCSALVRGL